MKQIIKLTYLFFIGFIGCNGSDESRELSGDYFLRIEGHDLNDVLSHGIAKNEIHANILRYNYNDNFIIAEQRPNASDDPLYEKKYKYKFGRNYTYYWIIIVKKDSLLGPLDKPEFEKNKIKFNVPESLILKPID